MIAVTAKRLVIAALVLGLVVLAAGCAPEPSAVDGFQPEQLRVSAAGSLRGVLEGVEEEYERESGVDIVYNFGASGQLQKQVEAGAPVDVIVSASPMHVDALIARDLVSAEETVTFAGNGLVVLVPSGSTAMIKGPLDLTRFDRLATGNPETAPHGAAAREWLDRAAVWERLQPRFVFAENVAQTLDYVARGEVDAGIGFRSEVIGRDDVEVAYHVPEADLPRISYVAATVTATPQEVQSARFLEYMMSDSFQAALVDAGFDRAAGLEGAL